MNHMFTRRRTTRRTRASILASIFFPVLLVLTVAAPVDARAGTDVAFSEVRDRLAVGALTAVEGGLPASISIDGKTVTFGGIEWAQAPVASQLPLTESGVDFGLNGINPLIIITNAPRTAAADALTNGVTLWGYKTDIDGDMWVYNRSDYSVQRFTPGAGTEWVVTASNLVEGVNRIGVYGRGPDGSVVGDGVRIWVGERYVSVPEVDILAPAFINVSNDVEEVSLNGTHNEHVRGTIHWYNARTWGTGVISTGVVDQGDWSVTVSNLVVGINPIYVLASNRYGDVAYDLTTVVRADDPNAGDLRITNAPPFIVSAGPTSAALSGTHSNMLGRLWWTVDESDTSGFFLRGQGGQWAVTVPVILGTNTIHITGRDRNGDEVTDDTTVEVGAAWQGTPVEITIVNTNPTVVVFASNAVWVTAWTTNPQARTVTWSNWSAGTTGVLQRGRSQTVWEGSVSNLVVGYNHLTVRLETAQGRRASDYLLVIRQPRVDLPLVEITSAPTNVDYSVVSAAVSGTNNLHVHGDVTWSNVANGVTGTCQRDSQSRWSTTADPLVPGGNTIVVMASNKWGDVDYDVTTILRDDNPVPPAVGITNAIPGVVPFGMESITLYGTNNPVVVAAPGWSNVNDGATGVANWGTTQWWTTVELEPGMNTIFVTVSNAVGDRAAAVASVFRPRSPQSPVVFIHTNYPPVLPPDEAVVPLDGTNNPAVVGEMLWVLPYSAVTGVFERVGDSWSCQVAPLEYGMNVIYVLASNAYGEIAASAVSVERLQPGGNGSVVITSVPPETVTYDTTTLELSGTNNQEVAGDLLWDNEDAEQADAFPSTPEGRWSVTVSNLVYGINTIYVRGYDAFGVEANDLVSVYREPPPRILYVRPGAAGVRPYSNWVTAAQTIQRAFDEASDGDIVIVGEGEYMAGRRFLDGEQTMNRLVIDRPVSVLGDGDPELTVLHGEWDGAWNAVRCVSISGGGHLSGVTLKDGHAEDFASSEDGDGGGARVSGGSLTRCRVIGNFASSRGGGVYAEDGAMVEEALVRSNEGVGGGGLFLADAAAISCEVQGNTAATGGGVMMRDSQLTRCEVVGNTATSAEGGGVRVLVSSNASVTACVVARNDSRTGVGGGLAIAGVCGIRQSTVADNTAEEQTGGIAMLSPGATMGRSILYGNTQRSGADPQFAGNGDQPRECLLPYVLQGNLAGEPLFKGGADYHVEETSPAVDAYEEAFVEGVLADPEPETDLDGVPRPLDGNADGKAAYDVGAYEHLNAMADTDGDGLLDGWEQASGLSPVSAAGDDGADGDPDDDGMDNTGEQAADTHPGDADSVLRILSLSEVGGDVHITVQGGVNAERALLVAPRLIETGMVWHGVATTPPPTAVTNILVHPGPLDPGQFYRVRARRR